MYQIYVFGCRAETKLHPILGFMTLHIQKLVSERIEIIDFTDYTDQVVPTHNVF